MNKSDFYPDWNALQLLRLELPDLLPAHEAAQLENELAGSLNIQAAQRLDENTTRALRAVRNYPAARERLQALCTEQKALRVKGYPQPPGDPIPIPPGQDRRYVCPVEDCKLHSGGIFLLFEGQQLTCPKHHIPLVPLEDPAQTRAS